MFDLYTQGAEDAVARSLKVGDVCWVLSYQGKTAAGRKQVVLSRFAYTGRRQEHSPDSRGAQIWVLAESPYF